MKLALLFVASLALASPALASAGGEELAINYNGEIHGWGSGSDAAPASAPAPAVADEEELAVNYDGDTHGWDGSSGEAPAPAPKYARK